MCIVLPVDEEVLVAMQPWKEVIDETGKVVVGNTKVDLTKDDCAAGECNLGNFFCDAMVHSVSWGNLLWIKYMQSFRLQFVGMASYEEKVWTNVSAGLMNIGGLRVPLNRGSKYWNLIENSTCRFGIKYNLDQNDANMSGTSR